jgi:LacI family transcriptional regulator
VSLVLRNHPRIPAKTREHVLQAVKTLGYERDPVYTALTARRANARISREVPGMAFLTNRPNRSAFEDYLQLVGFYEGATLRAEAMGYRCELLLVSGDNLSSSALAAHLLSADIEGLIIGAMEPEYGTIELGWKRFAIVEIDCRFMDWRRTLSLTTSCG